MFKETAAEKESREARVVRIIEVLAKALEVDLAEAQRLYAANEKAYGDRLHWSTPCDLPEIKNRWLEVHAAAFTGLTADEMATAKLRGGVITRHSDEQKWLDPEYTIKAARDLLSKRAEKYRVQMRQRLAEAGVAERHLQCVYDQETWDTDAVRIVRNWMADKAHDFLLLLGGTGIGKNAAAAVAAIEWSRWKSLAPKGYDEDTFTVGPLGVVVINAYNLHELSLFGKEAEAKCRQMINARWLVINDLGTEVLSEWKAAFIYRVLNERHEGRRKTLITSNIAKDKIRPVYGPRIADRLHESSLVVTAKGESRAERKKRLNAAQ